MSTLSRMPPKKIVRFPRWRKLAVNGQDPKEYILVFQVLNQEISNIALEMTDLQEKTIREGGAHILHLTLTDLSGLGLKTSIPYENIPEAARAVGLKPCPPEAGLALRCGYREQSCVGRLIIVTEAPITTRDGKRRVFCLTHYTGQKSTLGATCVDLHGTLIRGSAQASPIKPEDRLVFVL